MASINLVNFGFGNGLLSIGTKPLPEPMMTCNSLGSTAFQLKAVLQQMLGTTIKEMHLTTVILRLKWYQNDISQWPASYEKLTRDSWVWLVYQVIRTHDCLLNRLFRRRSKKTSKLHVTGLCAGNSPGTGEFPTQMASYVEDVSIWWRHHETSHISWSIVHMHYACKIPSCHLNRTASLLTCTCTHLRYSLKDKINIVCAFLLDIILQLTICHNVLTV